MNKLFTLILVVLIFTPQLSFAADSVTLFFRIEVPEDVELNDYNIETSKKQITETRTLNICGKEKTIKLVTPK